MLLPNHSFSADSIWTKICIFIRWIWNSQSNTVCLRGNPPSESWFFLENSIFQKSHIRVVLSVLFQNMYKLYMNGAYFDQLWRFCLFIHNVITAIFAMLLFVFLSFTFFLFYGQCGTFSRSISQRILIIFFLFERWNFSL